MTEPDRIFIETSISQPRVNLIYLGVNYEMDDIYPDKE